MTANASPAEWRFIGETVAGASHLRAGVPNQDAILHLRETGRGLPLVVSVSDGHGSNKCFRSDRGSRFAVKRAAQLVSEFLDELRGAQDQSEIEAKAKERLPREFVGRWREAVEADLRRWPFTPEELDALEQKDGARARKLVESNPLLAYGATSLTVALEESFALFMQLGDGEILTVSQAGEVARPLPDDERLFANETTSLCTQDAERNFRLALHEFAGPAPALILLSTDGYVNSFSDESGFLKVGTDLLDMLRTDGFDFVSGSLRAWLEEATRMGSGDDTTLAVVCRMDALTSASPAAGATAEVTPPAQAVKDSTTSVEAVPPSGHPAPTQTAASAQESDEQQPISSGGGRAA